MLQNQGGDDPIEEDRLENIESNSLDNARLVQDNHQVQNQQSQPNNSLSQQQLTQQPHSKSLPRRPTFAPSFPIQTGSISSNATLTPTIGTPLTNHEIYELTQRSQQQQLAGGQMIPASAGISKGSFKQSKRQSLYVQRHKTLERQSSIIVGTPGFRERYGK